MLVSLAERSLTLAISFIDVSLFCFYKRFWKIRLKRMTLSGSWVKPESILVKEDLRRFMNPNIFCDNFQTSVKH